MAKEIIGSQLGSFGDYVLLPGYTRKECDIPTVSLETSLGPNLNLRVPLLSAAMMSVTGYDLSIVLSKEGGLPVLPAKLPVDEQARIVSEVKHHPTGFVENPLKAGEYETIAEVLEKIDTNGHSRIPICDRNNVFLGIFEQGEYYKSNASLSDPARSIMTTIESQKFPYTKNPEITMEEAKKLLGDKRYLVVLDSLGRLEKIAFAKDVTELKIASAISSHKGWQERVRANVDAGVDLIVIDTSDAYNEWVGDLLQEYKSSGITTPICAGNVVTYDAARYLLDNGANMIKGGMSVGSICTTAREKAVGRSPMPSLLALVRAAYDFAEEKKLDYVPPVIWDGGVPDAACMIISLAAGAKAIMAGNYFNHSYEAAGEKLDDKGKETIIESKIRWVATWGEGSIRAQNLDRYGHSSQKTFFAEGVEDKVEYWGHLKPYLKRDMKKIKAALMNAGCMNLDELRKNAVLEYLEGGSHQVVKDTHHLKSSL